MKTISNIIFPILKGTLFVILGVLALIKPVITLELLTLYFGLAVTFRGIYLLYFGFKLKNHKSQKKWTIVNGLIDIIFGLILFIHPAITLELLPFIIGLWAIMGGLLESAIATTQNLKESWPKFLFGIIMLIFGWVILLHPLYASILVSNLLGGLLIFIGLGYIIISIALRKLFY